MQIRCGVCAKTIAIAPTGALPPSCPHCERPPVPERIGDYAPDRLIATGGMGEVYHAHHAELGTEVALKLLPAMSLDASDGVRRRFAREAKLAARVQHPGMVRVLHSDVAHDRPYLVLEFVRGETLRRRIDRGALPVVEAARIAVQVADVLAAAHAQGVLHRDVKPDNVMLQPDGAVRVLDFGIARALGDDAALTRTGELVGTPEYMAPEQLLDGPEATDERTDVHAVGLLLYELLTARSPFRGANLFQALKLVESLVPRPPSESARGVPAALDEVVARATAKRAEDRHPTMAALRDALLRAVPATRHAAPPRDATPHARWPLRLSLLATAAALLFALLRSEAPRDPRPEGRAETQTPPAPPPAERVAALLRDGRWTAALADAVQAERGDFAAVRPLARAAFALTHAAWYRAADLPAWLAASERAQRQRLFGDLLEPADDDAHRWRRVLTGDDDVWAPLAEHAAARLLRIRELPAEQRADSFADYAARLPIDAAEHWLARTVERHLRADRAGAEHAAEMAWLAGAGEVAVLLDAALLLRHQASDRAAMARAWARLAKADRADCPASALLMLRLEAAIRPAADLDPSRARAFPAEHRDDAVAWLLRSAQQASLDECDGVLRLAVALGAQPDFTARPWSALDGARRERLQREAAR